MRRFASSRPWGRVVIAGGEFAALGPLLALRALGDDWARVELIAPSSRFDFRAAASAQAFDPREARSYDVQEIAADLELRRSRRLAVGARASAGHPARCAYVSRPARPGAVRWRAARRDRRRGAAARVCASRGTVISRALVRAGASLRRHARRPRSGREHHDRQSGAGAAGSVRGPTLSHCGGPARAAWCVVRRRCPGLPGSTRSIRTRLRRRDRSRPRRRRAAAQRHEDIGVPTNPYGFVPTDADGRVVGLRHVYAAGDVTTFRVKQSGIVTQQADRIAEVILTAGGAGIPPVRSASRPGSATVGRRASTVPARRARRTRRGDGRHTRPPHA